MDQEQTPQERARELVRLLVPDWQPTARQVLWVIRVAIVLGVLFAIGYAYGITLWEWAKLLIVPAAIAGAGLWFNQQQRERELQIADQRAQTDQEIADQRRQDDMLQAYLDGMSQLLTDKDRPLHKAQLGDSLSTVARARTLAVLARLDGERKGTVLQFLHESGLIAKERPVLNLRLSDLTGTHLGGFVNLDRANLGFVNLSGAELDFSNLSGANLSPALLNDASLVVTNLSGANLSGANLSGANLLATNLAVANLEGATVTDEQLARCRSLKGATMPNGQKYEDWLKDKEGTGEDGENP